MRVLFLGPDTSPILQTIRLGGDEVVQTENRVEGAAGYDWIVSHGYRYILKQPILDQVRGQAINCHISLLPWNRGADPNFWSYYENTPSGVSVHFIDMGIDTGDLIAQTEIEKFTFWERTLRETYDRLQSALAQVFAQNWSNIRIGECERIPQPKGGSFHYARELPAHILSRGWDTLLSEVREAGSLRRMNHGPRSP